MTLQASCPSCGAAIEFRVGSSLVTVCEYCRSAVARTDRGLEDLGKVADLAQSQSPLDLWLQGRYENVPFTLTGRAQIAHPGGGFWDEWYLSFADGRWGWLAEAQGRFQLTFEQPPRPDLPPFAGLELGETVSVGTPPVVCTITEKSHGRHVGARGEIPYRLVPGAEYPFADLAGADRVFGTLDYSEEPPRVYLGREVTLDELGIPVGARPGRREPTAVPAVTLNCPRCGGAIDLRAPDQTQRVGCPQCGALLDCREGGLKLLEALKPPRFEPAIPLGAAGKLEQGTFTCLGYLRRSVRIEGTRYTWEEYLLYEPRQGYRWLVCSDGHWSFIEPAAAGDVVLHSSWAEYRGRTYKAFQRATARVDWVVGEFYWKVKAGEKASAFDLVSPPYVLTREVTVGGAEGEIVWSHGTYLTPKQVRDAFGLPPLPPASGVAPNQPFPYGGVYPIWGVLMLAAIGVFLLARLFVHPHLVFQESFTLQATPTAAGVVYREQPFELRGGKNVAIGLRGSVGQEWTYVEGELHARATGKVTKFSLAAEGSENRVFLSALPAGAYTLRLEGYGKSRDQPAPITLRLEQGVPHVASLLYLLGALSILPGVLLGYQIWMESQRWQNSSFEDG